MTAVAGLRVLDCSDESGRLAGRLLTELGADVLRVRRGVPGAALPGLAGVRGGVLDWWYDGGTRSLPLDLDDPAQRDTFRALVARSDVLIETEAPGRLAALGLDPPALATCNPRLAHVSLTPFGATGPRASWQASDLVASALGGVLAVSGTPDEPLNGWGRQSFNIGAFYAAIAALVALRTARAEQRAVHVDLSLQQCVLSCTEHLLMYWFFQDWFPGGVAARQGSLHWSAVYEVVPCATGHAMITPAPNAARLFRWMAEDGMLGSIAASPPRSAAELFARAGEVMDQVRAWARTKDAAALFAEGQARRLPIGAVHSVAEAAASPQMATRGFLRPVVAPDGATLVRSAGPAFHMTDTPAPPAAAPPAAPESAAAALACWPPRAQTSAAGATARAPGGKPLAGVRVVDFSWVLAGPKATRVLGDLGADVVKLQTEIRAQGTGHNDHPFFLMWNRSKRGVALDMKHARAAEIVRRLVERADVVVENFAPGVLERWGVGYETMRGWNERIVYLGMSGCGRDGPWRDHVTFAPTIHALCGLTALTNPPGRRDVGHGVSISDHVSGLAGALAVLAALEARERTGRGQLIDLSQLEVGAYLLGPAFLELASGGREAVAQGNRDGLDDIVPNEVYRCADGGWLAISARDDDEWRRLCAALGSDGAALAADPRLREVVGRRVLRAEIDAALGAWAAGRDAGAAMHLLQEARVAAGKVQSARDLTAHDPQLAARDAFALLAHASVGTQGIERFPGTFSGVSLEPYRAAPAFGEHTFEVYGELLGMSEEEIALAIADGLFA